MSSFTTPSLIQLDENRRTLEIEAASIVASLTEGPIPMGVDLPLVDAEGYPRADIDVYLAKTLRGQLAKLRTDHAKIMQAVEKGLTNKEGGDEELRERLATKPKPKYDNVHNAWVVRNWDGTCSGIPGGNAVKFEDIGNDLVDGQRRLQLATLGGDAAATSTPASSATSQTTTTAQIRPNRGDVMEAFAVFDQIAGEPREEKAPSSCAFSATKRVPRHELLKMR